ncbi:hypothetical protein PLESTF_001483300 [Pleodorina starrii]|nr:hypothetical protein PLESTM_000488500 [Pleodorina starrii]GLC74271.1 hypothetical protein PLESTF_001483300 [Pleodorina starrii]
MQDRPWHVLGRRRLRAIGGGVCWPPLHGPQLWRACGDVCCAPLSVAAAGEAQACLLGTENPGSEFYVWHDRGTRMLAGSAGPAEVRCDGVTADQQRWHRRAAWRGALCARAVA